MTEILRVCGRVGRGGRAGSKQGPRCDTCTETEGANIKNAKKESVWRALHKRRNIGAKTQQTATLCVIKTTFEAGVNSQGLEATA